jgi:hypothetical protein
MLSPQSRPPRSAPPQRNVVVDETLIPASSLRAGC